MTAGESPHSRKENSALLPFTFPECQSCLMSNRSESDRTESSHRSFSPIPVFSPAKAFSTGILALVLQQKKRGKRKYIKHTVTLSTSRLWKYCAWIKRFNRVLVTWEWKYSLNSAASAALSAVEYPAFISYIICVFHLQMRLIFYLFFSWCHWKVRVSCSLPLLRNSFKKKIFWSPCGRREAQETEGKQSFFFFPPRCSSGVQGSRTDPHSSTPAWPGDQRTWALINITF